MAAAATARHGTAQEGTTPRYGASAAQARTANDGSPSDGTASPAGPHPVVTISATFGAASARVGETVAHHFRVPLLDRALPLRVADQLGGPLGDVLAHDEHAAQGIDPQRACDQLHRTDQTRTTYLRHLCGTDPGNPRLYHLIIDTTVVPPQAAADAIVVAATAIATRRTQ